MRRYILITMAAVILAGSLHAGEYLDPHDLKVGSAYVVSRQTPVMPEVEPADPMAALGKMKQIPIGGAFKIDAIQMKNGKPWYSVRAIGPDKKQIGSGFINSTALLGQSLTPYGQGPSQPATQETSSKPTASFYRIASSEDLDYRNPKTMQRIRRKEYRVHLTKDLSQTELKAVAENVIAQAPPVDAIVIFLYLLDSEPTGAYTAGKATFAPDGKWENAGQSGAKKLIMEYGGALGIVSKENQVDLPLSKKKAIFMTLVGYQDQGMDNDQSYAATARRYGITKDQAQKIAIEGVVKNWSMP